MRTIYPLSPIRPAPKGWRANEAQLAVTRASLHDAVDVLCDSYHAMQQQADNMGRGFGSAGTGTRGSDHGSIVERLALDPKPDPGQEALEWLAAFTEARAALIVLVKGAHRLIPDQPMLRRQVTGADCEACRRWVPGSATDRLRSGFCDACRKAWERFSDVCDRRGEIADRAAFVARRQGHKASN